MRQSKTSNVLGLTSWRCDDTTFHKMCNVTHILLVIGKDVMRLLLGNVQCHSLAVGHREWYDETAFHKVCNVTHLLLVIGKDVMRLPFTKCAMLLTCYWSSGMMWWDSLSQNVQYHSLAVGHRKDLMRLPFRRCAMSLTSCWSLEKIWWDCCSQNVQCHSLAVGHRKRSDETTFHKRCYVTHCLLVIGEDLMRLPFTKCAMSLTGCWS